MKYSKEDNIIAIQLSSEEYKHKSLVFNQVEKELGIKLNNHKWSHTYLGISDIHLLMQEI